MGSELAEALEQWIERGVLWDAQELRSVRDRLATAGALFPDLDHVFEALRLRLEMCPISPTMRRNVEAVVYPRLWKIIDAARQNLPDGEQRTRIQVLNRRLAQLFVAEDPRAPRKGTAGD
jgi:hypothetical protein